MRKGNPTYTEEFKRQMVGLQEAGWSVNELHREYKVSKTALRKWIHEIGNSGELGAEENRSEEEMRHQRKENKQLRMEVDILKQAAQILGRKDV